MIKYITGDLLEAKTDIVAHGLNCLKVMGAGVALQIARKWPEVARADRDLSWPEGERLGKVHFVRLAAGNLPTQWLANCYSQFSYGSGVQVDYGALTECLKRLRDVAAPLHLSIALPRIGAGLAGGKWATIEGLINRLFGEQELFVYTLPGHEENR